MRVGSMLAADLGLDYEHARKLLTFESALEAEAAALCNDHPYDASPEIEPVIAAQRQEPKSRQGRSAPLVETPEHFNLWLAALDEMALVCRWDQSMRPVSDSVQSEVSALRQCLVNGAIGWCPAWSLVWQRASDLRPFVFGDLPACRLVRTRSGHRFRPGPTPNEFHSWTEDAQSSFISAKLKDSEAAPQVFKE